MRSLLFVPGSRPRMLAKVADIAPDVAVVDLEDAVPAADKAAARADVVRALDEGRCRTRHGARADPSG
jgi:citrate lyase subunit beta/citryl-CoA lyase